MMRYLSLLVFVPFFSLSVMETSLAQPNVPKYKKIVLSDKFHAEGATIGDFNKDGVKDVAIGHY